MRAAIPLALCLAACGPSPAAEVAEAREVGIVPRPATIAGRDGGGSVLAWGRSVWLYGDTVLRSADADGLTWHDNSFSFTTDLDPSDGLSFDERTDAAGAPVPFVAPTQAEAAYNAAHRGDPCAQTPCGAREAVWPGAPVYDAARDRVLAFYGLIRGEPGEWNFYGICQSLAVWDHFESAVKRPEFAPGHERPTCLFGQDEPAFGAGAAIDGEFLYSFGCEKDFVSFRCKLARVPLGTVTVRAAWRFWDGDGWSADLGAARPVMDGAPSMTVWHDPRMKAWAVLHSAPLSNDVTLRTAPDLAGPWSSPLHVFTADRHTTEGWVYDAQAHPEMAADGGRVHYVSFSRPDGTGMFGSEIALVRVTFR